MNLRIVRKKIKSIKNVRKITKAMQMVSAVKMRKAQQAESESRPYRDGLSELIIRLSHDSVVHETALGAIDTNGATHNLIVLVTSNKGLAGAFNMNLFRYLYQNDLFAPSNHFIVIGSKGAQMIARIKDTHIIANFTSAQPVSEASAIFDLSLTQFRTGMYRSVSLIYNRFISTLRSEVAHEQILPLERIGPTAKTVQNDDIHGAHVIEPSAHEIVEQLIISYLEQQIRGAIVSSEAVEHSSRMMAMKSATENASELIYDMTLLSNRLRQEKITNELLDMMTAKESVASE